MTTAFVIPSNPVDRKKILSTMDSICDALTRISGEKDFIKAEIDAMSEEFEVPKKVLNKFVRTYYAMSFAAVQGDTEDLVAFYEALTGKAVDEV